MSEARANAFAQGSASDPDPGALTGKDIDDFVREYRELRKVYHKRMIWGEKWGNGDVQWRDD